MVAPPAVQRPHSRRRVPDWVVLLLALLVLAVAIVVVIAKPATAEQFATLHPKQGVVEVGEDDGGFVAGQEGQTLEAGDVVRTGDDGRAEIEYFDGSVTRLDASTVFGLEELSSIEDQPGSRVIEVSQQEGRTFQRVTEITGSESRFDVETPTATASVRGTLFDIQIEDDGTIRVLVLPDDEPGTSEVVVVLADGTEIVVREGEGLVIFGDRSTDGTFSLGEGHLTDPWVIFNLCDLEEIEIDVCEPPPPPEDPPPPEEPEEPEETPAPEPSPTFIEFGGTPGGTTGGTPDTTEEEEDDDGKGGGGGGPKDTTPPVTRITEAPPHLARAREATFRFEANEAVSRFDCSLDGGTFAQCSSPRTYTGLADGDHVFQVKATDLAGNREATATHRWTIDNAAPDTIIDSGPDNECSSEGSSTQCYEDRQEFHFHATEGPATFECRLDEEESSGERGGTVTNPGEWEPCTSPTTVETPNSSGTYTFAVRATDRAENQDETPARRTWTYYCQCEGRGSRQGADRRTPSADPPLSPQIVEGPASGEGLTGALFSFVADLAATAFECALDGADFETCTSPLNYVGLAPGPHVFRVRALGPDGRVGGTAAWAWTVEGATPDAVAAETADLPAVAEDGVGPDPVDDAAADDVPDGGAGPGEVLTEPIAGGGGSPLSEPPLPLPDLPEPGLP